MWCGFIKDLKEKLNLALKNYKHDLEQFHDQPDQELLEKAELINLVGERACFEAKCLLGFDKFKSDPVSLNKFATKLKGELKNLSIHEWFVNWVSSTADMT